MYRTQLEIAKRIAHSAHNGQKRRDGQPYTNHLAAVAAQATTEDEEIVAWLHDVLEDTPIKESFLLTEGISLRNVASIKALTRIQGEDYLTYLKRVECDLRALFVKSYDLKHNLSDLSPGTQRDKYLLAQHIVERNLDEYFAR